MKLSLLLLIVQALVLSTGSPEPKAKRESCFDHNGVERANGDSWQCEDGCRNACSCSCSCMDGLISSSMRCVGPPLIVDPRTSEDTAKPDVTDVMNRQRPGCWPRKSCPWPWGRRTTKDARGSPAGADFHYNQYGGPGWGPVCFPQPNRCPRRCKLYRRCCKEWGCYKTMTPPYGSGKAQNRQWPPYDDPDGPIWFWS